MTLPNIAAIFAVTLLAVVVCYIVLASYNAVVALRLRIDKAWANIGVVLRQRHDPAAQPGRRRPRPDAVRT